MDVNGKIEILADAAKYDASCSSSGSARPGKAGGLGSTAVGGICHSWSSDGRCISLLKVLLTNACAYDCAYCANRRSNDLPRACFEPEELVRLIMDFYRRNYIEGAFLSSGVLGSPDATMERLISVARRLRTKEGFNGYIHLKIIPGASEALVLEAARWADRVSVNIELPSAASLSRIAPDKSPRAIFGPMRFLAQASGYPVSALPPRELPALAAPGGLLQTRRPAEGRPDAGAAENAQESTAPYPRSKSPQPKPTIPEAPLSFASRRRRHNPRAALIPAGQTTQLIVGASPESDALILNLAENLYHSYDVRRVYYSAFVPTGGDPRVPQIAFPPLAREHRLYQADWLFRFYGFSASEILDSTQPFLDLRIDPKSDWALRNLDRFPLELVTAEYEELLRVPGIGPKSAQRIIKARRHSCLNAQSLYRLGIVMRRAAWFLTLKGQLVSQALEFGGLKRPELLKKLLMDPAFRQVDTGQPELPWESAQ
ncbi:MAG: putative DNA modification/repair radical SAM protein [Spirochaetia bacterium]|jgi:putative DNA modification/repair radical SAM protein|nr:putative DNA modification/repair radical SAM protein [Spirochaetia bacterium]